jgi:hypothetical protein
MVVLVQRRTRQKAKKSLDISEQVNAQPVVQPAANRVNWTPPSVFYPDVSKSQRYDSSPKPPMAGARPPITYTYKDTAELQPGRKENSLAPIAKSYSDLRTHRRQNDYEASKPAVTVESIANNAPKHRPTLTSKVAPLPATQAPIATSYNQNPLFRTDLHLETPSADENV